MSDYEIVVTPTGYAVYDYSGYVVFRAETYAECAQWICTQETDYEL